MQTTSPPETLSMYLDGYLVQDGNEVLLIGWEDYTFQCVHSDPAASISWRLGGTERTSAATSDNMLTLRRVLLECGLELQCSHSGSLSVTVTIKVIVPPMEAKMLLEDPENAETLKTIENGKRAVLSQGQSYTFNCQAEGIIPEADFHWSLDDNVEKATLAQSDDTPCSLTDSMDSFTLMADYDEHQEKILKCRASNEADPIGVSGIVILDVTVPPDNAYISKNGEYIVTDELQIVTGTLATITCTADNARPAATIEWFLDGDNKTTFATTDIRTHTDSGLVDTTSDLSLTFTSGYCNKELRCVVKHPQSDTEITKSVSFDVLVPPSKPIISFADGSKVFTDALFGFERNKLTVSESDAEVIVTLNRTGPYDARTSARLSVDPESTAMPGADYRSSSFLPATVEFEAGKATRSVVFYLEDDDDYEFNEKLILSLDMPDKGKILPGKNQLVITIEDSEGVVYSCSADEIEEYAGCKDLETFSKVPVTRDNVKTVADTLAELTAGIPPGKASPGDVSAVARILENIVKVQEGAREVSLSCIESANNLIIGLQPASNPKSKGRIGKYDANVANSTSSIVQFLQKQTILTLREEGSIRVILPNIVVVGAITYDNGIGMVVLEHIDEPSIESTTTSSIKRSSVNMTVTDPTMVRTNVTSSAGSTVQFTNDTISLIDDVDEISDGDKLGLIFIPAHFFGQSDSPINENSTKMEVIFICYSTPVLFPNENSDEFIDSVIISANVRGHTAPETTTTSNGQAGVRNKSEIKEDKESGAPVIVEVVTSEQAAKEGIRCDEYSQPWVHHCVFWDFEFNDGNGGWSTKGCRANRTNDDTVTCHCDHLTNFAVLATFKEVQFFVLDWISKIGCYVTIGCLGITLIIFTVFKKPRKVCVSKAPRQVLFQFCLSLLLLTIAFLVLIDRKCPILSCEIGAILLHYFMLSSMMWMAVQTRYLYHKLASVLYMDYTWFIPIATILSWGVPLIPVVPTIVLNYESYQNDNYCFLVPGYTLYYGLFLPIGLIILHNFISFIIIMHRLRKDTLPNPDEPERLDFIRQFRHGFLMTVLMATSWVSAFLAIDLFARNFVFSLIFCVCNGLQGVAVLFFCFRQSDVYKCCKCCNIKIKGRRSLGGNWTPGSNSLHSNPTYYPP
ncbi:uncharacterized protein [Amphiura filiformis]|uniref:uncharacterized protein n=1 Tax=Amphiura filiformis TaxID=82378 RepID=UPI003B227E8A